VFDNYHDKTLAIIRDARLRNTDSRVLADMLTERTRKAILHFEWLASKTEIEAEIVQNLRQQRLPSIAAAKEVGGKIFADFFEDFLDMALELAQTSWSLDENVYDDRWVYALEQCCSYLSHYEDQLTRAIPAWRRVARKLFGMVWQTDPLYLPLKRNEDQ
jgi:hypothetical protein